MKIVATGPAAGEDRVEATEAVQSSHQNIQFQAAGFPFFGETAPCKKARVSTPARPIQQQQKLLIKVSFKFCLKIFLLHPC